MEASNLAKIKEDFNKVISFSQDIPDPKTDKLFDIWVNAKRTIIRAFGDQYIYEYPEKVCFELGQKEKHSRVMNFALYVEDKYGYSQLAEFIESQEEGFFKNITTSDYRAWNGKLIKKGTKLIKAFKHFIENERSLADIQSEASRIIQEDKIEGTLCLSVHPLDYLSLSENTYNWRSCHSLDGEYRAGNLSYMMDEHTIVCYLKASDSAKLPNFPEDVPWNSKKWRVLLYLSRDVNMLMAGRQYPFETSVGMDFILKEVVAKMRLIGSDDRSVWSNWNNTYVEKMELSNHIYSTFHSPYIPVGHTLVALDEFVQNAEGSKHYNDVLYSSCYTKPLYAFKYLQSLWNGEEYGGMPLNHKDTSNFHLGGFTYCLWCGEAEVLDGADTMMCEKCELEHGSSENELFTYCDCCGRRIYADDAHIIGDEDICEDCYDKHASVCERCGEVCWNEDIHYYEENDTYLCSECLDEINEGE